ncbi:MAG TPA: hypothetical protein VMM76_01465 [Pirellulaceae bacterium]|nr:hypothetical protein [Pirellulaceae bacterium]
MKQRQGFGLQCPAVNLAAAIGIHYRRSSILSDQTSPASGPD